MHFSTIIAAAIAIAATSANPLATPTPCTTTIEALETLDLSPTTTIYLATHTATSLVDCHGCSLTIENLGGVGPVRHITATVIDDDIYGTTTTTTVCSATPTTSIHE